MSTVYTWSIRDVPHDTGSANPNPVTNPVYEAHTIACAERLGLPTDRVDETAAEPGTVAFGWDVAEPAAVECVDTRWIGTCLTGKPGPCAKVRAHLGYFRGRLDLEYATD